MKAEAEIFKLAEGDVGRIVHEQSDDLRNLIWLEFNADFLTHFSFLFKFRLLDQIEEILTFKYEFF